MLRLTLVFAVCLAQVMGGGYVCNLKCPKEYIFLRRVCLCYHVSKPGVTDNQSGAVQYCNNTGGHLFYMRNCNQLDELRYVISSQKLLGDGVENNSFWTLSTEETDYYEDGTYSYYLEPPVSRGLLYFLRPDRTGTRSCLSMLLNPHFMNFAGKVTDCSKRKRVICELYPTSN